MGHFHEGYRLKCRSPRTQINVPNVSPTGSEGEKDQMEVVVSPPPVSSTYPLSRFPESPPGIHSIMYSPHPIVDSAIHNSQCHVQVKTEQEAVNYSNSNVNRNFRCSRKESRLVTNGSRVPQDYALPAKQGTDQAFNMSPSEKKSSPMNGSGGGNSDSYFFGKVLESSMENLMKFAEVLYKCTLCTTLPSILTSRDSFISHVNDLHLTKKQSQKECQHCNLKFSTEEDLRAHCRLSHSMETHPGDEVEQTEPSPIDEFTNKSEIETNTENQFTVSDPTKSIQNRTSRFIMESVHSKQRQAPTVSSRTLIRVAKRCSPGKETIKPEKIPMDENISRLQQLADQILISNTRLTGGAVGAAGSPSGFYGATANPSYTPDFGKYTKLIREGGNIVYFCQVCNCKCQARAAFMGHCSSYQHRARIEAADRSVNADHVQSQGQSQQTANSQSTQPAPLPPPPAHSHPHSQRHQPNSHQSYHQQSHPLLLSQPNFKRDYLSSSSAASLSPNIINCSITNNSNNSNNNSNNSKNNSINNSNNSKNNSNTNYSTSSTSLNNKKNSHYSGHSSSSPPTSTTSLTIPTSASPSTNIHPSSDTTNARNSSAPASPISISETSQISRSGSEENRCDAGSPSAAGTSPGSPATSRSSAAATMPSPESHLHEDSRPTREAASSPSDAAQPDRNSHRKRHRVDGSSDGDSNCDKEVTSRQRRKRHAPVAVRHPQVTTSWSDSESEDDRVGLKSRKMSIEADSEEDDNDNTNDDDVNAEKSSNSNTTSSSSSSDGSRKSSTGSSRNTDTKSSNNDSNSTIQSSSATNTKDDAKQKQSGDNSEKGDLNTQPNGSPDTDQKSPNSPRSSPVPTRVLTPKSSPEQTNETPIDFSITDDANCGNLPTQSMDSLGVLSSVVEGFLVSTDQAPVTAAVAAATTTTTTTLVSIKTEPEDSETGGLRSIYRCSFCEFVCYDIRDYEEHFIKEHDPDLLDVTLTDSSGKTVHGEYWKMLKIKDILPELLVGCAKGYVSRDILLQKISLLLNIPEVVHWGPACNKAVREEFPNSLAQRKGKFKNYYFGVALIEQLQEQDELSDSENVTYQPLRDLAQDLEKILQFLPELVFWTGDLDVGISRDEVLQLLGEKIEETGVQYWGVQCNRAMRFLFPSIHMKRKGKFKTVYFGVDFMKNITRQKFDNDQTLFIKSEALDDSYESVEPKTHHSEMSCAIFPTNIPVPTSPSPTSTTATTRSYAAAIE